jgi:hypothetical protein
MGENIDRAKVLRFFAWTNRELGFILAAAGSMAAASWITYLGVSIALMRTEKAWILGFTTAAAAGLLAAATFLIVKALRSDSRLSDCYSEVGRAKRFDFASILVRSFKKTDTALDGLIDFEQPDPVALRLEASDARDRELLEELRRKAVFLSGQQGDAEYLKFYFDGVSLVFEHSPIAVTVLYLTSRELIAYLASADIVRGTVAAEEVRRVPLQKVIDVAAEPVIRRAGRIGNERLFHEYERVIKNNPSHEIVSAGQSMRISIAGGEDLIVPASPPDYWHVKRQGADTMEKESFGRIAREISQRARQARATAEGELRPEL